MPHARMTEPGNAARHRDAEKGHPLRRERLTPHPEHRRYCAVIGMRSPARPFTEGAVNQHRFAIRVWRLLAILVFARRRKSGSEPKHDCGVWPSCRSQ